MGGSTQHHAVPPILSAVSTVRVDKTLICMKLAIKARQAKPNKRARGGKIKSEDYQTKLQQKHQATCMQMQDACVKESCAN